MKLWRLLASFILPAQFALATEAAERNVVLIVGDDHGQDAGCYGNPIIRTPNLDTLAAGGTLFTHAFATTASCSASRSVILTGLYNHKTGQYGHEHGYHHFRSFENLQSLPVALKEYGYRTASIGKFHVAPREVYRFDEYLSGDSRNPVEMAEKSRSFITSDPKRPFFLYFCTSDPHRGGGPVEDSPYRPDRFGNRPEGYRGIETVLYDPDDVIVPGFLPDTPTTRAELAQYYQSVSRLDQGIGRLVQVLEDAGVMDHTLILYISDHGIAFPGAKTTTYEPGLKSPCIVRNPYVRKRGVVSQAMINWADLTPTILEFAAANNLQHTEGGPEKKLHGRSFLSILEEENPEGWDEVYASHTFHEIQMYYPMRVVRRRDFKLIWNIAHPLSYPFASDLWASPTWQEAYKKGPEARFGKRTVKSYLHRPEFELYDMTKDPWETTNLADKPEFKETLEGLKEKLINFQRRTEDPWILKWQYE